MIKVTSKTNFPKTTRYLEKLRRGAHLLDLDRYGREGVVALAAATPRDTGLTASSWSYRVVRTKNRATISFHNSNIQNGVPIAIILQYGHGTRNGGWVQGRDYINPAIQSVFDKMASDAWREVTSL